MSDGAPSRFSAVFSHLFWVSGCMESPIPSELKTHSSSPLVSVHENSLSSSAFTVSITTLPPNRPKRAVFFFAGVSSHLCVPRHTGGLWATHGRSVVVIYSLFSVVVIPGSCSMGFLLDRKFWHYPKERFTLLQKACHVVEIACPRSVLTVSLNLFYKTEGLEVFNGRVYGFPIHTALLCNDSPWWKAGAILAVAVPKQTAVHGEVPRL